MRTILNISVPEELALQIKRAVKKGKYASTSEYIRALIRQVDEWRLLRDIQEQNVQFEKGKGKVLHSFKDLR